jgi:aminomethyltransferase
MGDLPELKQLPLAALHARLGARFAPFAGYEMPVQYAGILAEHKHTRSAASVFDVSHMGQARLEGGLEALERLVPSSLATLPVGRMRYTVLLNELGGVVDDLMVYRAGEDSLHLVLNAGRKNFDIQYLTKNLTAGTLTPLPDLTLLALQGPQAAAVLAPLVPASAALTFLSGMTSSVLGAPALITRSGYTGEDGFEISLPATAAAELLEKLLADARVQPAGLGARDTLRLEAGLALYGQDLSESISPIEAGLAWVVDKRRREGGGFLAADTVLGHLKAGAPRSRIGLVAAPGSAPVRAGSLVFAEDNGGKAVGKITSGSFSPTLGYPIALALVESAAVMLPAFFAEVRGERIHLTPGRTPFVPTRYVK